METGSVRRTKVTAEVHETAALHGKGQEYLPHAAVGQISD
jgi:hypothetical protein